MQYVPWIAAIIVEVAMAGFAYSGHMMANTYRQEAGRAEEEPSLQRDPLMVLHARGIAKASDAAAVGVLILGFGAAWFVWWALSLLLRTHSIVSGTGVRRR